MHYRRVSHTGYLEHGNSKSETIDRSRYKNNSKRVARHGRRERGHNKGESPKQGLTETKYIYIYNMKMLMRISVINGNELLTMGRMHKT